MNKEKLIELKSSLNTLAELKSIMATRLEMFDEENKKLSDDIKKYNQRILECKAILKENAIAGFEKDGLKKRLGGVGIQERFKLNYSESDAIDWAKEKSPIMIKPSLDKKTFETYAKTNFEDLSFVTNEKRLVVTFPKEIKLEDKDGNNTV